MSEMVERAKSFVPTTEQVRKDYMRCSQVSKFVLPGHAFDNWLSKHDAEIELAVYERIRHSASTPYSFYPYLDSAIARRKSLSSGSEEES